MKLIKIHEIKIGEGKDQLIFYVKITNRAMIEYESMSGGDLSSITGTENLLKLFYCASKAGAKSEDKPFDITYEQFIDVTDDYYFEIVTKFSEVLGELGGGGKKLISKR